MRRASACAPRPAELTTASNSARAGAAAAELHAPTRRPVAQSLDRGFEGDHAAATSISPHSARIKSMKIDEPDCCEE